MQLSFFSNYFNSHQLAIATELSDKNELDYAFVSLQKTDGVVGREALDYSYPFVIREYESGGKPEALFRIENDDVVIFGDMAGKEEYVRMRARTGKPFLRYAERLLKRGDWWRFFPLKFCRTWSRFTRYSDSSFYVLCASAYTCRDLSLFGFPPDKCVKWGYFPDLPADISHLLPISSDVFSICSVQRLVPWKRVDLQLRLVRLAKDQGLSFHFNIVGDGPELKGLVELAHKLDIEDVVTFLGEFSRSSTLELMKQSDFFLATSNRKEGWGATINEAMSAGCCVLASEEMGSVPYLIENGYNGVTFFGESPEEMFNACLPYFLDRGRASVLASHAIETINGKWSARTAASRLVEFCESVSRGGEPKTLFNDGPLSPAS